MRVPILVLALVVTPFVASISQTKTKSSAKRGADVQQQGQNRGDQCQQQGQHEGSCARTPATTPPPVTPPPVTPPPVTPPPPTPSVGGLAQIRGTVYNDLNRNGIKDLGEPGLAGWTIQLSGTASGTTTSGADGTYQFVTLPVGSYTTCAAPQAGWVQYAPSTGPTCAGGFGWSLSIPANLPDMWWVNINFGVALAPAPAPAPVP